MYSDKHVRVIAYANMSKFKKPVAIHIHSKHSDAVYGILCNSNVLYAYAWVSTVIVEEEDLVVATLLIGEYTNTITRDPIFYCWCNYDFDRQTGRLCVIIDKYF